MPPPPIQANCLETSEALGSPMDIVWLSLSPTGFIALLYHHTIYSQGGAWLGYGVRQAGVAAFFALWLVQANLPPPGPNDPPSFWCAADQCASRMPLILGLLCFSCVAVAVAICQSWKYVDFGTRLQRARQPNRTAAPYEA
jgi:hypothetical protein